MVTSMNPIKIAVSVAPIEAYSFPLLPPQTKKALSGKNQMTIRRSQSLNILSGKKSRNELATKYDKLEKNRGSSKEASNFRKYHWFIVLKNGSVITKIIAARKKVNLDIFLLVINYFKL